MNDEGVFAYPTDRFRRCSKMPVTIKDIEARPPEGLIG